MTLTFPFGAPPRRHERLVLRDDKSTLVVEIFPDRLQPKPGWTAADLALGMAASLCLPTMGGKKRPGWNVRADGEWLAKLDEAKGPFDHPCGRAQQGAFFVARGAPVDANDPVLLYNGYEVIAPNGQSWGLDHFRGNSYSRSNAATAIATLLRYATPNTHDTLNRRRKLMAALAVAQAFAGQPWTSSSPSWKMASAAQVVLGIADKLPIEAIVRAAGETGAGRWDDILSAITSSWHLAGDRPWAPTALRIYPIPGIDALIGPQDRSFIATGAAAARAFLDAKGPDLTAGARSAHATMAATRAVHMAITATTEENA